MIEHADTYVALLRGINVGGRNRVPMAELRAALAGIGLDDVVTYIQSGNVVFRSSSDPPRVAEAVQRCILETFELDVDVVLRTRAQLTEIAARNPYVADGADSAKLHVVFLDREPFATAVAELDPRRSPPDEYEAHGPEIYLHLPNGIGRTKLSVDYFERRLGVAATARNWNTVLKLVELVGG